MPSPATGTLTVNAAFFQEIKEVNQDLWRLLNTIRDKCSEPALVRQKRSELAGDVETLRDQLALHFALEEAYGYFEDPVYVAPRLCERAVTLRTEHRQLYLQACALSDLARDLLNKGSARSAAQRFVQDFAEFDKQLARHEEHENELIQQEYSDDIGVGD